MGDSVFVVLASGSIREDLFIAAYDNRQAAERHRDFIENVDNEWRAEVRWSPLHSEFDQRNDKGLRELEYLKPSPPHGGRSLSAGPRFLAELPRTPLRRSSFHSYRIFMRDT